MLSVRSSPVAGWTMNVLPVASTETIEPVSRVPSAAIQFVAVGCVEVVEVVVEVVVDVVVPEAVGSCVVCCVEVVELWARAADATKAIAAKLICMRIRKLLVWRRSSSPLSPRIKCSGDAIARRGMQMPLLGGPKQAGEKCRRGDAEAGARLARPTAVLRPADEPPVGPPVERRLSSGRTG